MHNARERRQSIPIRKSTIENRKSNTAFTLIELVLGMALSSIVLLGITSAIVLASRALPREQEGNAIAVALDGGAAITQLVGDVRHAIHFAELTATAVTFAVPDRDGDGYPERLRYHWSGVAGSPLYRSYNGGADAEFVPAVDSLVFTSQTEPQTLTYTGADTKSVETTFAWHIDTNSSNDFKTEPNKSAAQTIKPSFASNVLRWQVSRALFMLRYDGPTDGVVRISVRNVQANGKPGSTVLMSGTFNESVLTGSYLWYQFMLNGAPVAVPGDRLAFVFEHYSGGDKSSQVRFSDRNGAVLGYHKTDDGGASWDYRNDDTLLHAVYGYYWTPGPTRTLTRQRYNRFAVAATLTGNAGEPIRSGCNLLNKPYQAQRFWRLTFDESNPTLTDANADGLADWKSRTGSAFDAADIAGGVWNTKQIIDTHPDDNLSAPTTIELRMKATAAGQAGPQFRINADWTGNTSAGVYGRLTGGSSSQTLDLYLEVPGTDPILKQVTGLPLGMIDVMVVVDPVNDEVALFADSVHYGTWPLVFETDASDAHSVTLEQVQAGAVFDHIAVVVGGSY